MAYVAGMIQAGVLLTMYVRILNASGIINLDRRLQLNKWRQIMIDTDKQVELVLENLDMMSEQDALEWIAQQDEEFIELIAKKIWEDVRNQETVQVPKGISEDEFLEWLVEDFHIETATGESLDEFAKYTPVWKLPDESCEDYRKRVLDLMNREK